MLLATVVVNTVGERASLGLMTTLQGMGITFAVLVCLQLLTLLVSKIVLSFSKPKKKAVEVVEEKPVIKGTAVKVDDNKEMIVDGVDDEETIAVIMAIVAFNTGSELSSLKFNYIKAID